MNRARKILCVVIAGIFLVSACTTTHSYAPGNEGATRELKIQRGDQIRVVTTQRERLSFKVTDVRADRFIGVTVDIWYPKENLPAGTAVEVPFDELAVLEITRSDPAKTAIGVAAALVTLTGLGAVLSAMPIYAAPAGWH